MAKAAALLDPVVSRVREEAVKAAKLRTDDTPVPMLNPGRGRIAIGRLWVYAVDDRASGAATPPLVWYRFTRNRSGTHPQRELATFTGLLQANAHAGYGKLYQSGRVAEVACWAYFRRKIFNTHQANPTPLTTDLLDRIGAFDAVETGIRGPPPDLRARAHQEQSRPLIETLRAALDDALRRLSPKSEMAKVCRYGVKLWPALLRFLGDDRLEIDNNIAERAMRSIAVGRRKWLFAGSERAAAIYTVITSCKANRVDPQTYIADVIAKIATGWPAARWDELMPWNWQVEPARLAA